MNHIDQIYEWRICDLPNTDNDISKLVKRMNRFSKLPWPYYKHAERLRIKLKKKIATVRNISFQFDISVIYGNLHGGSVWFSNTYILDYAPIFFGEHVTIGPDVKLITSWHEFENLNIVKVKSIVIEDNVWITMNSVILPGVTYREE